MHKQPNLDSNKRKERERDKIFYCGCIIVQSSWQGNITKDTIEVNNIVIIVSQSFIECNHRRQARVF